MLKPAFSLPVGAWNAPSNPRSFVLQSRRPSKSSPINLPPSSPRRTSSLTPVIAWLTPSTTSNASILAAASNSCARVIPVCHACPHALSRIAHTAAARRVYYHPRHVSPLHIQILRENNLCPIPVALSNISHSIPLHFNDVAVASAAAVPLLLEKKGDSITRFFQENSDSLAPLSETNGVDDRPLWERLVAWLTRVYLPTGFPHTTTPDYLSFTKYRTIQNLASAIMQVISTEALLFGLGLGKTVAAGAAATSWVLKDGASYVVKIFYGSVFGSKFDDDPKSWRIAADIVEDVGGAIEILTPLFPLSYFLPLASLAVCLRGMSLMTGTATRHVVYRSLAASGMQNTGDIATKGESQGVTMKMIGLGTGIIVSSRIGQKYYALLGAYAVLASIHIAANWKSVQCVQFSFFNKQRASILIENYLQGKPIPTPYQVSSIEKVILPPWRGFEPGVKIGVGVKDAVSHAESLHEAKSMFRGERFLIFSEDDGNRIRVLLGDKATSNDALRAYFTIKRFMQLEDHSQRGLQQAHKYMKRGIKSFQKQSAHAGWDTRHMLLSDGTIRVKW